MVLAHGGGGCLYEPLDMIIWSKEACLRWNACLILPHYRLSPEVKQPTGQLDVMKSFLYFHEHAQEFNIDPNRMTLTGESGGAMIALGA